MSDAKPHADPSMEEILASISRIIADDKQQPGAVPAAPGNGERKGVLELTEALGEDGTVRRIEPKPATVEPPAAPRLEPEPPRMAAPPQQAPAEPKLDPGMRDQILSAATAGAAAAALGRLATMPRTQAEAAEQARGGGPRTLEDIVSDALRPLLRSWLDEHLPALAERLAREEITRIAERAGLR